MSQTNLSELEKIDVNKVKDVNKKCVIANIKILIEQIKWNLNANTLTSSPATTTTTKAVVMVKPEEWTNLQVKEWFH